MRMHPVFQIIGLLVCVLFSVPAMSDGHDKAQIQTVNVADGIYMLVGSGGNIGVSAGDDGVLIIDDQFEAMNEKIRAAIADVTDQPVKMLLNTHWHGDHTGGNQSFAKTGALIIAHNNVRTRMSTEHFSEFFNMQVEPSPAAALPVVTFDSGVTLHLNKQTIEVQHVGPAHTDGDSVIWFKEANVAHLGDIYFNNLYPFIDLDSGGSLTGMITALRQVVPKMDDATKVMPGHGPLSDRRGVIDFLEMLETVNERITTMIAQGKTEDEIVAAKPTAEFDDRWGKGFIKPDRWVKLVHQSLTTNP